MTTATITDIIPHRPPFVMIDSVIQSSEERALSALVVRGDNVLVEDGVFTESGLVENMAQTAAAGLRSNAGECDSPKVGYIGSLKNLVIHRLPKIGETIITEVLFVQEVMGARIVHGSVRLGEEVIAECELRIFLQQ